MKKITYSVEDFKHSLNKLVASSRRRCFSVMIAGIAVAAMCVPQTIDASDTNLEYKVTVAPRSLSTVQNSPVFDDGIKSLTELVISKANAEDCKDVALMDKWQSNLESLSAFDNDWDGEGAVAVSPTAISNCRDILNRTIRHISELESIIPTPFGSVCLEWRVKSDIVNAEISANGIAFYRDSKDSPFFYEYTEDLRSGINELIHQLGV